MKKLLSLVLFATSVVNVYAEWLSVDFIGERSKEAFLFDPLNIRNYEAIRMNFFNVDPEGENVEPAVFYELTFDELQQLGLSYLHNFCAPGILHEGYLNLNKPCDDGQLLFPGLNAESFGLIMRLRKDGYDHVAERFTTKSFDSFLRMVVDEGLKAGRPVLGCKTSLTLALKLATVLDALGSIDPVQLLMELATSNEYLKMSTAEDVEIISQMAWSIKRHIGVAFNNFTIPYWTCIKALTGHGDIVWSVAFSPNGKHVASGDGGRAVRICDVSGGICIKTLTGHGDRVWSVAFSPDGKYIASGSGDNTVRIWDVSSGICMKTLEGHGHWVWSVAFSPDGKYLASGSYDGVVRIWDVSSGICIKTLTGNLVNSVAFSPDGKYIASGRGDRTVRIWDVSSGDCIKTLEGHENWVRSVTFSPDGKYLASGSGDNTVRVWDLSSGICIKTLEGHGDIVWSVAFSPDGKYLASGCSDRTVRIWDVNSGACIKTLEGHGNWVKSVTFSPDGKHVASGGDDETVRIWGAGDEFDTLTFAQRWGFMVANAKNPFKNRSEMVLQVNMLKDLKKVEYKTPMHVSACSLARPVLLASARHLPSAFRQISVLMSQRAPADVVQRFFKAHEREFGTRRNEVGADVVRYTQEFLRERRAERLSGASSSKDS